MTGTQPEPTERLFTAVPLPEPVREFTAGIIDELSGIVEGVRWVPRENLHVTLRFLGQCSARNIPTLVDWMEKAARQLPESVEVGGVGGFPSQGSARVVWVGVTDLSGGIEKVYNVLDKGAGRCGLGREKRRYRPHVTIGRARKRPVRLTPGLDESSGAKTIHMEAPQIVLYRSDLSSTGAVYTEIARTGPGPVHKL